MKQNSKLEVEIKGLIDILTTQTKEIFSINQFKVLIDTSLEGEFRKGLTTVDKEIKPQVNTILPRNITRQLEALYNYVEQNLQNHVDQVGDQLRQEMQRGLQNRESKEEIIKRVKRVFKDDKGVISRLKTVIRTESNRAFNTGALEAAQQAESNGIQVEKWLDVHPYQKGRSSAFCNTARGSNCKNCAKGKYGEPKKAIPINENFILKDKNKTVKLLAPPFHVNCRTTLRIQRVGVNLPDRPVPTQAEIDKFLKEGEVP